MKLLLHTCCTDCLLKYLEITGCRPQDELLKNKLAENENNSTPFLSSPSSPTLQLSDITLFFYNPNIYPKTEYEVRLASVKKLAVAYKIPLIIADYQPDHYFNLQNFNLSPSSHSLPIDLNFPPPVQRCSACWQLRLLSTAQRALNFNKQVSTPTPASTSIAASPPFTHFSTTLLVSQYQSYASLQEIGNNVAQENSLSFLSPDTSNTKNLYTTGFYKQNYCGCLFSLIEKTIQKYL